LACIILLGSLAIISCLSYCFHVNCYLSWSGSENHWNWVVHKRWNIKKGKKLITTPIFTEFLKVLDASVGVQGRNVLLFVGIIATHPKDMLFLLNLKFVYYPPNGTTC
jgi:hypothetical protein